MKFYINKQVTKLFSAALLASSLTACDDFLSIVPLKWCWRTIGRKKPM